MSAVEQQIHPNTQFILDRLKKSSDLPTVLIFHGPMAEIKLSYALELIDQMVNPSQDAFIQKRILEKNHPDVQCYGAYDLEQYALTTVKLFIEEASLPPFELKQKWVIIDEAQKLSTIHCNMLLKTLEEPAVGVHFLLIVDSIDSLLPTILSRAIRVPFFSQARSELSHLLEQNLEPSLKVELLTGLLQGSIDLKPLIELLDENKFFEHLHLLCSCHASLKPELALNALEAIDQILNACDLEKKNTEVLQLVAHYFMLLKLKIGEAHPQVYRDVPSYFELYDFVISLMKRHTKLRYCIEKLAIGFLPSQNF